MNVELKNLSIDNDIVDKINAIDFFPHKSPRTQQIEAINFVENAFNSGKRFVAICAATGVGKSAIGLSVARWLAETKSQKSWFVTTQKVLQDQYTNDFSHLGMTSIKSAKNYACTSKCKKGNTCAESQAQLKLEEKGTKFWNDCMISCHYKSDKRKFLESDLSITNFPYFLTDANFSVGITKRGLLVIDECHNTDKELGKFIEISVSERFAKSQLNLILPILNTQNQAHKWIQEIYLPAVQKKLLHIQNMFEKYDALRDKLSEFTSIIRNIELLEGHCEKLINFISLYEEDNWVFDLESIEGEDSKKLVFKPIDLGSFSQQYIFKFAEKVLFMSATIIDSEKFAAMLGIKPDEIASLELSSPFPKENRPIICVPVASMSANNIEKSLPVMAEAVRKILEQHKNEKGIIHTNNFRIANYLIKNIHSNRLMNHTSENREEVLKKHIASKSCTVLVSPSMTEGVDLADDASRFQIICKIPYPYLGDKLVRKRMNKWNWWYPMQVAKTIVQSIGRSVRSDTDHAVTYILDADWNNFYRSNSSLFNDDFKACLIE